MLIEWFLLEAIGSVRLKKSLFRFFCTRSWKGMGHFTVLPPLDDCSPLLYLPLALLPYLCCSSCHVGWNSRSVICSQVTAQCLAHDRYSHSLNVFYWLYPGDIGGWKAGAWIKHMSHERNKCSQWCSLVGKIIFSLGDYNNTLHFCNAFYFATHIYIFI